MIALLTFGSVQALRVSEIVSNPIGDDGGREWFEVYNDTENDIDLSLLTISIKGGNPISVTPVSGGTSLRAHGYAVIGSMVSGATKVTQDYPSLTIPVFRAAISLVNTGTTSLEIRLSGSVTDSVTYTGAKEGYGFGSVDGIFVTTEPTPGEVNRKAETKEEGSAPQNQVTLSQGYNPLPQLMLYLPKEKKVAAGAFMPYSVVVADDKGAQVSDVLYTWSFGDGGYRLGATTSYAYHYDGTYILEVEATNGKMEGRGRMKVSVYTPELMLSPIGFGKYGNFIEITNNADQELDISGWYLSLDGAGFKFPKNTFLGEGVTRFPGLALGFASTTVGTSTVIKLLFPTGEEVTRVAQVGQVSHNASVETYIKLPLKAEEIIKKPKAVTFSQGKPLESKKSATSSLVRTTSVPASQKHDTRFASWIKNILP